jgi:anti-anti-sigma factor
MSDSTRLSSPKVEWIGNLTILTFTANATRDVEDVLARELEVLPAATAQQHLLLNFTHVKCLNSTELGTLISFHQRAKRAGGRLTLFALSPLIFELFTVARLDTFLEICRDGSAGRPRAPAAVGTSDALLART